MSKQKVKAKHFKEVPKLLLIYILHKGELEMFQHLKHGDNLNKENGADNVLPLIERRQCNLQYKSEKN
jgi:hypothetical protein